MDVPTTHRALAACPGDLAARRRGAARICDALLRFGLGQDLKDAELFGSAFTADAELDFRPAAARWGAEPPVMRGRDTIVTKSWACSADGWTPPTR